jgi:hypothetical protein
MGGRRSLLIQWRSFSERGRPLPPSDSASLAGIPLDVGTRALHRGGAVDSHLTVAPVAPIEAATETVLASRVPEPPDATGFWTSFLMAAALTGIAIGVAWDISWHESIGRDAFWTPAHMVIYFGGMLGGFTGGWI